MSQENRDLLGTTTVQPFDAAGLRGAASVARQIVSVQAAPGIDLRATIEGLLATIAARDAALDEFADVLAKETRDRLEAEVECGRLRAEAARLRAALAEKGDDKTEPNYIRAWAKSVLAAVGT